VRITFVIPTDNLAGGVRVVAAYAERLQQRGHTVTVVSAPHPQLSFKQRVRSLFQASQAKIASPPHVSYFQNIGIHHRILDRYRPLRDRDLPDADVVIATWWETAEWIAPLSSTKGAKVYFIQHHEVFDYLPQDRTRATYRLPFFKIAVSQWLVDVVRTQYQVPTVTLVPNGVDFEQFYSPVRSKAAIPTVGLMYSTTYWKGCDISLQAIIEARRQLPNLRLVAFGSTPPTDALPLPANTQYFLQPAQDTLKDIYAQCDAWLFGSRVEGFGLPILEAMACRSPVIATPAGAAPELLAKGGGVLIQQSDPNGMAEAICKICTLDSADWDALSTQAYETAGQYRWSDATEKFEAALQQACCASAIA
jgi:glycosyltransferase involved in cell wall biosynthesis